jgi:hypothetical protein
MLTFIPMLISHFTICKDVYFRQCQGVNTISFNEAQYKISTKSILIEALRQVDYCTVKVPVI